MNYLTKIAALTHADVIFHKVRDIGLLVKFKLTLTVVYSAVMAYLIAATGSVSWGAVGILALGGFCITGAANALNEILEKDYDKIMKRTANRPVATGRMSVSEAVIIAGIFSIAGLALLATFNLWTSFFGAIALFSYAFLYTPMKRVSPSAIAIGAFPGAMPMLIGAVAFQGELTPLALALFAIEFFWQFPHFGAISWLSFKDYSKAGYKFVATKNGEIDRTIGLQGFMYAMCLVPIGLVPYTLGITGIVSAIIMGVLAVVYAWFGWNLYRKNDRKAALMLMFSSFFYLPFALTALWLDKI